MRTAVDSSVLLDILLPDPEYGPLSAESLRDAIDSGAIVACEIVWAEVRAAFSSDDVFRQALEKLGVEFSPTGREASQKAGALWRQYRSITRGSIRGHLIPDFVIGAHAMLQADVLLGRDRGFYRRYFSKLKVIDPSNEH